MQVAFSNAKGISHTDVDRDTTASILRLGKATRGDFSNTEEGENSTDLSAYDSFLSSPYLRHLDVNQFFLSLFLST